MLIHRVRAFFAGGVIAALLPAISFAEVPAPAGEVGIPYQIEGSKSCAGSGCILTFPVTPAKRRVDLSLVNCAAVGTGNLTSVALFLVDGATHLLSQELVEDQTITSGGGEHRRLFGEPSAISIGPGRHLTANVLLSSGSSGIRCSLFGTLVFLP
jgi:hypothetical protein